MKNIELKLIEPITVGVSNRIKIGVDIKPNSMNIDWNEVKHSLVNLKNFVEKSNLMWGISNDYVFDEKFFEEMISKIEVKE